MLRIGRFFTSLRYFHSLSYYYPILHGVPGTHCVVSGDVVFHRMAQSTLVLYLMPLGLKEVQGVASLRWQLEVYLLGRRAKLHRVLYYVRLTRL